MAWPGKLETYYFTFTICWNPFRVFGTSTACFLNEKRQNTVTFQKIRQSAGNERGLENVENLFTLDETLVGSSETIREIPY